MILGKSYFYKKVLFWYQTSQYKISSELRIVSRFCWKLTIVGGSPYFGFYCILIKSVLKFAWGGYYIYPPPLPTSLPLPCVHLFLLVWFHFQTLWSFYVFFRFHFKSFMELLCMILFLLQAVDLDARVQPDWSSCWRTRHSRTRSHQQTVSQLTLYIFLFSTMKFSSVVLLLICFVVFI